MYAHARGAQVARPATDRQIAYIRDLVVALYGTDNMPEVMLDLRDDDMLASAASASAAIDRLRATLAAQRARRGAVAPAPAPARAALAQGMYRREGIVYRVVRAQAGHLYAKALNPATGAFDYAPGAMRALTPEDRMTVSEAAAYGRQIGRCCVCGATLTDPESVARGIGPICGKRV